MVTLHSLPTETVYRILELGSPWPTNIWIRPQESYAFLCVAALVSQTWTVSTQERLWRRVYLDRQRHARSFVAAGGERTPSRSSIIHPRRKGLEGILELSACAVTSAVLASAVAIDSQAGGLLLRTSCGQAVLEGCEARGVVVSRRWCAREAMANSSSPLGMLSKPDRLSCSLSLSLSQLTKERINPFVVRNSPRRLNFAPYSSQSSKLFYSISPLPSPRAPALLLSPPQAPPHQSPNSRNNGLSRLGHLLHHHSLPTR